MMTAAGLVVAATAGVLAIVAACGPSSHNVSGTVLFRGAPLGDVMLCFHAGESTASCMSATTSADGAFAVGGLPEGRYKVTVRSLGEGDGGIPSVYSRAESTRFALSVTDDLSAITMMVESR